MSEEITIDITPEQQKELITLGFILSCETNYDTEQCLNDAIEYILVLEIINNASN